MLNDIRIVCLQKEGVEKYCVCRVIYKENGDVNYSENPYSEYDTLEEAYAFVDQMYKASLKPLLFIYEDGSFH
ncbi:hypothetical protein D3C75_448280 [compost metagenome]